MLHAPLRVLQVPPLACPLSRFGIATERAFDAWSWCASDVIEWRRPLGAGALIDPSTPIAITSENPADLVFVFREGADSTFLPRELARFHAKGYGLDEEWALAPYAIDDATDLLFERGMRPADMFWLAAPSLRALVWGLHDWVHFHNHGPFDEVALTELACDLVALEWVRSNAATIGLSPSDLSRIASELHALSTARFVAEGKTFPDASAPSDPAAPAGA